MSESDLRGDLSPQVKELILRCLTVDEGKRISVDQIEGLAYFRRNVAVNQQIKFSSESSKRGNIPQFLRGKLENGNSRAINIRLCQIEENERILQKKENKNVVKGRQ